MKPLFEQDHYEILEVSRDAAPEEIERAYRVAASTYGEDSMARYAAVDEGDAAVLNERIQAAYRTLADADRRRAYDAWLRQGEAPPGEAPTPPPLPPVRLAPPSDLEEMDDGSGEFDGPRLRRSRLRSGVELEEIAAVTKISPTYLRCLEEERFADLPAAVYVRGFVTAYARCVGLEPRRVAASYMKRFRRGDRRGDVG